MQMKVALHKLKIHSICIASKCQLYVTSTLTAPYFHDASAKELKDAVSAMLKYQSNVKQPTQKDVEDITSFLESLTGEFKGEKLK